MVGGCALTAAALPLCARGGYGVAVPLIAAAGGLGRPLRQYNYGYWPILGTPVLLLLSDVEHPLMVDDTAWRLANNLLDATLTLAAVLLASSRSARLIGRIRRVTIRPAPEWVGLMVGVALPVSRNRPGAAFRSTPRRTTSQTVGTRCHSSTRSGGGKRSNRPGSAASSSRCTGSSNAMTVFARRSAVAVLPTPFGPSRLIAASSGSSSSSSRSTTRQR
jgi:hypothetical protein